MPLRHPAAINPRHRQRADDAARRLADAARPLIARAMAGALGQYRRSIHAAPIADAIAHGQKSKAIDAVGLPRLQDAGRAAFAQIEKTFRAGAEHAAGDSHAAIGHARQTRVRKDVSDQFAFDFQTDAVSSDLRDYQDEFIRQLDGDARDVIEKELQRGVGLGLEPAEVAARIKSVVGLTDVQAQYVDNYRSSLRALDRNALSRALTSDESDDQVRAAINSGSPLSDDEIDLLVQDYSDNWIAHRSLNIADTESVRATSLGLRHAYQQGVDRGVYPEDAITRHWKIDEAGNVCPVCRSIPENNPDGVGLNEPFNSDDGDILETPAHTRCRCSIEFVTDLAKVNPDAVAGGDQISQDANDSGD